MMGKRADSGLIVDGLAVRIAIAVETTRKSHTEIAVEAKMSKGYLSQLLNAESEKVPSMAMLNNLAIATDTNLEWMAFNRGPMRPVSGDTALVAITDEDIRLLLQWRELTPEARVAIRSLMGQMIVKTEDEPEHESGTEFNVTEVTPAK